jgi:DUF4097 and DUF4098 domain-containing protein YvlB
MNIKTILTASLLSALSFTALAGEKVNKQLEASADGNVEIENVRGEITITGWDKNTVSVVGELDDKTEKFIFEKRGNGIFIKVKTPRNLDRGFFNNGQGSKLTIKIPENSKLNFSGVSTNVDVNNILQRAEIKSVSGEIKANNLATNVVLSAVSGNINSTKLQGKISLESVSGNIIDKQSAGRLNIESVSGDIKSLSSATEVSANAVSGEITLNLEAIDVLELNTVSGDIDVHLSLNKNGTVDASSVSGNIRSYFQKSVAANFRISSNAGGNITNKLTDDAPSKAKYGPNSRLRFETGDGNGSVEMSTVSGNISLDAK